MPKGIWRLTLDPPQVVSAFFYSASAEPVYATFSTEFLKEYPSVYTKRPLANGFLTSVPDVTLTNNSAWYYPPEKSTFFVRYNAYDLTTEGRGFYYLGWLDVSTKSVPATLHITSEEFSSQVDQNFICKFILDEQAIEIYCSSTPLCCKQWVDTYANKDFYVWFPGCSSLPCGKLRSPDSCVTCGGIHRDAICTVGRKHANDSTNFQPEPKRIRTETNKRNPFPPSARERCRLVRHELVQDVLDSAVRNNIVLVRNLLSVCSNIVTDID